MLRRVRGVPGCSARRDGQRFEGGVVIEREMNAFVGVDEDDGVASRPPVSLLAMALSSL